MTENIKNVRLIKTKGGNVLIMNSKKMSNNDLKKMLKNLDNKSNNSMSEQEMTNTIISLIRKRGIKERLAIFQNIILKRTKLKNYILTEKTNYLTNLREFYLKLKGKRNMNNNEYNFNSERLKEEILNMYKKIKQTKKNNN